MRARRSGIIVAIAAGGLCLAGVAAVASDQDREGDRAEIAAVLAARTAPADAIKAAEAKVGGKADSFSLEHHHGAPVYQIEVTTAHGIGTVTVDPATGMVTPDPRRDEHEAGATATGATVSLAAAVSTAEQAAGGRTVEADTIIVNGQPAYDVSVGKADTLQRVTVSGTDGRVLLIASETGDSGGESESD